MTVQTAVKVPIDVRPGEEHGFVVTCPGLPELFTQGETVEEAVENARDAFEATMEIYREYRKQLPPGIPATDCLPEFIVRMRKA